MRIAYATLPPDLVDTEPRFIRPPLAAGYLAAYATRSRGTIDTHDIVTAADLLKCQNPAEITERLLRTDPHLVAITSYVWNRTLTYQVIRMIRSLSKSVRIAIGGPEVSYNARKNAKSFLADWICTGEGEIPFTNLLNVLSRSPHFTESIPGLISLKSKLLTSMHGEIIQNLDEIPSPYLLGLIQKNTNDWMDLETVRGCPFSCRFCLYGKGINRVRQFSVSRIISDIEAAIKAGVKCVYIMDPTFNFPKDRCSSICRSIADVNDGTLSVYVEARAELVDELQAREFDEAGIKSVEVGLQSTNVNALTLMGRSLGRDKFVQGCKLLRERGIHVDIGIILGLPEDDEDSVRRTVDFVLKQELGFVSIYRLQVLPGSELAAFSEQLGLRHQKLAPYFVQSTLKLSITSLGRLEKELSRIVKDGNVRYLRRLQPASRHREHYFKADVLVE